MAKIKHIFAREILNAKGNPTVEATVILSDNVKGTASCPSGTSVGKYEAAEIKDADPQRYNGLGVLKAIDNINSIIAPKLIGVEAEKQTQIDKIIIELDSTINKSRLGVNAILPISMACAKASAKSSGLPLFIYLRQFLQKEIALKIPTPAFNFINGGKHADGNLDFQEILAIPATSKTFSQSLQMADSIYFSLKNLIKERNGVTLVGDEGGFSPLLATNYDAILLLKSAIDESKFRFNYDVFMGMDLASSNFYKDGKYTIKDKQQALSTDELLEFYRNLNHDFRFLYMEDPFAEDDFSGWTKINQEFLGQTLIVGDDLVATNPYRLQMALEKKAITGLIVKPNQIGTVIEALAVVEIARQSGLKIIVSHRSGETNDDFIADFAVAAGADYVKFGAPARGERVAKYNRLLEIEEHLKTLKTS